MWKEPYIAVVAVVTLTPDSLTEKKSTLTETTCHQYRFGFAIHAVTTLVATTKPTNPLLLSESFQRQKSKTQDDTFMPLWTHSGKAEK